MKLIHIDDSNFQRKITKRILDQVFPDWACISLSDSELVDLMVNENDFDKVDILITDLLMDKISGQDVIKYFRSMNENCCIVVLSSNIQKTEKEMCFENGANYFIEKPLTSEKINEFKVYYNDRV